MVKCLECGSENEKKSKFCQECGMKLPAIDFNTKITGNSIIDTLIWVIIILVIVGLLIDFVIGPLFSLL